VSLNRSEQQLFEYIEANRDERHFWEYKVRGFGAKSPERSQAARLIEAELRRYCIERARVVSKFKLIAEGEGVCRMSLLNLAEHLLRLWVPLPVKPKRPSS
jgi:hypothetical protein